MATPQTLLDGAFARRLERLTLVSRKRLIGQGQGDRRSLRKGSSLEFADYRHYVEGDDPARVDWNIYSRTDQLFVRLYEEEEVLNVHLLVDASRSMDWGEPSKLRYARRLAAALGLHRPECFEPPVRVAAAGLLQLVRASLGSRPSGADVELRRRVQTLADGHPGGVRAPQVLQTWTSRWRRSPVAAAGWSSFFGPVVADLGKGAVASGGALV